MARKFPVWLDVLVWIGVVVVVLDSAIVFLDRSVDLTGRVLGVALNFIAGLVIVGLVAHALNLITSMLSFLFSFFKHRDALEGEQTTPFTQRGIAQAVGDSNEKHQNT